MYWYYATTSDETRRVAEKTSYSWPGLVARGRVSALIKRLMGDGYSTKRRWNKNVKIYANIHIVRITRRRIII
jgi:hypothetical protein